MIFNLLILLPLVLVSSSPTPSNLSPRSCMVQGPSTIAVLDQGNPNTPSTGQQFTLSRKDNINKILSAVTFEYIPPGATGCMLEITIPALSQPNEIASGSATQANVWKTDGWTTMNPPTYNNQPNKQAMISTTIFPTDTTDTVYQTILASDSCRNPMSFLFELSTWQTGEGHVSFVNSMGGKIGLVPIGFKMIYNC